MGLHNLQENDSTYAEDGQFIYPTNVSNTTENIDAGGVYVVFNGVSVLLWIHRQVSPALLTDLFGEEVTSLETLNPSLNTLPEIDTDVSIKARRLIKYLANRSGLEFWVFKLLARATMVVIMSFHFLLLKILARKLIDTVTMLPLFMAGSSPSWRTTMRSLL